jgi:hypothetical protein
MLARDDRLRASLVVSTVSADDAVAEDLANGGRSPVCAGPAAGAE